MILTMTTTIGAGGSITIPEELLEEAGLKPGTPVEVAYRAGRIEIEPASVPMRLEKRGRLTVLVPEEPIREEWTNEKLNEFIEELRDERMREILGEIPQDDIDRRD
jgi:AbrB family looped-hinge helix DNA binding protein